MAPNSGSWAGLGLDTEAPDPPRYCSPHQKCPAPVADHQNHPAALKAQHSGPRSSNADGVALRWGLHRSASPTSSGGCSALTWAPADPRPLPKVYAYLRWDTSARAQLESSNKGGLIGQTRGVLEARLIAHWESSTCPARMRLGSISRSAKHGGGAPCSIFS